jgi:hypothetical protein
VGGKGRRLAVRRRKGGGRLNIRRMKESYTKRKTKQQKKRNKKVWKKVEKQKRRRNRKNNFKMSQRVTSY